MPQNGYDSYFDGVDPDAGYNAESQAEGSDQGAEETQGEERQEEEGSQGGVEGGPAAQTPSTYGSYTENQRIRELEQRLEQQNQMLNKFFEHAYSSSNTQQQSAQQSAPSTPNMEDIDWDDPEDVKRKLPQMIQTQTAQQMQQLQQQMQQTQYMQAQREAQRNELQMRQELESIGMGDLFNEVQDLIRQWGMSPEQLAQPNAYQSIAQYALGQREFRKRKNAGRRPPNLGGSGPSEQSQPRQRRSSLSDEDARVLEDLTSGRVDPEDIEFFNSRAQAGPVTMADFENFENNKSKKRK